MVPYVFRKGRASFLSSLVGQYQHDLDEAKLSRSLDAVVEDCVNAVGVDANTASAPLLARVSGIGDGLAQNIVRHREMHGRFPARAALKRVARLGPKAFELCAGCASRMAQTRSTPRACIRKPIRSCSASWRRPGLTSRR